MMRNRRHIRKPDSLLLLAAVVLAGMLISSGVHAGDLIDYRPADPGTRLMSLFMDGGYVPDPANPDSRVLVSFTPSPVSSASSTDSSTDGSDSIIPSRIIFNWRFSW